MSNRVDRIRSLPTPSDWRYVSTNHNPADLGTGSVHSSKLQDSMWLNGPKFLHSSEENVQCTTVFPLLEPDNDKELRTNIVVQRTQLNEETPLVNRFTKFRNWSSLIRAIARLRLFVKSFKARCQQTQILVPMILDLQTIKEAENFIIRVIQTLFYLEDLEALQKNCQINRKSNLIQLNPFVDSDGILRVGGRLKYAYISQKESQPFILPGRSHVARLIVLSCHEKVVHQGGHIT